jgi:hypothetical protein
MPTTHRPTDLPTPFAEEQFHVQVSAAESDGRNSLSAAFAAVHRPGTRIAQGGQAAALRDPAKA